ncbi:MAG TPA: hypothetical protein VMD99_08360 [Terriglobales bacterium]|nr:hypothetical protein [Terriglobales bacterium]
MSSRNSIFESVAMLALVGILAGAIGGLGIGLISKSASSSSSSTSSSSVH